MGLPSNVILVGPMGSGKTSSGKELASLMGFLFLDIDRWIEEKQGKKVAEIFAKDGEAFFREQERSAIRSFEGKTGLVLAPGGGAWLDDRNREILLRLGWCVWLMVSPQEAWKRVEPQILQRPLLARSADPKGEMERVLKDRIPFYSKAHFRVETDGRGPQEVARKIFEALKKELPFDLPKL